MQGLRKPFYGGWGWVKMSATMVGWRQKNFKKHWLKQPKSVGKKTKFGQKHDSNLISGTLFLKIFFRAYFFIFVQTFQWTSSGFFLISDFPAEKSQSQQKLARKDHTFHNTVLLKKTSHFTNLNSLDIENNMLPQHSQKPFWFYKFSRKHVSVWWQKKYLH